MALLQPSSPRAQKCHTFSTLVYTLVLDPAMPFLEEENPVGNEDIKAVLKEATEDLSSPDCLITF